MQFHFTPAMLERRFDPEELAEYTRRLTAEQARQMDRALRRQYPRGGGADHRRVHPV